MSTATGTAPIAMAMSGLRKDYGGPAPAVRDVSLDVKRGEFLAILGPSGSGKTTMLMMIAGFVRPDSGSLVLEGKDITSLPPEDRGIGVVFQNYALFPHLSVSQNIAFPLEMMGMPKADIRDRVEELLDLVGLEGRGRDLPHQLSGGQQQRVAVARALAFRPKLLLMDEPLGALDKQLRLRMQHELRELHRKTGTTIIFVTHDQEEALGLAGRVAIMEGGSIVQVDSPRALYGRPQSRFVATFVGECNMIPIEQTERVGDKVRVVARGQVGDLASPDADLPENPVLAVRPHFVRLDGPGAANGLQGEVIDALFGGDHFDYIVRVDDELELIATVLANDPGTYRVGDKVSVSWSWNETSIL